MAVEWDVTNCQEVDNGDITNKNQQFETVWVKGSFIAYGGIRPNIPLGYFGIIRDMYTGI